MKKVGIIIFFLAILVLISWPQKIRAEEITAAPPLQGVIISEVLCNSRGVDESGLEFLELYNTTSEKVDIKNWQITITNTKSGITDTDNIVDYVGVHDLGKKDYSTEIPAYGYALIVGQKYKGQYADVINRYTDWNFIMVTGNDTALGPGYIPNTTGRVLLTDGVSSLEYDWGEDPGDGISWEFDSDLGEWAVSGGYFGSSPGYSNQDPPIAKIVTKNYSGKAPLSIQFDSESYDPEGTKVTYEWVFSDGDIAKISSPKHTFSLPGHYEVILYVWDALGYEDSDILEVTVFSGDIVISEAVPNPRGEDEGNEYVELYNKSNKTVDLNGWQIKDDQGGGITLIDEKIKPHQYKFFSGSFYFNNSSPDSISLYYPGGTILADQITYSKTKSGYSLSRFGDKLDWTYKATPGGKNILTNPPASQYKTKKYYSYSYRESSSTNLKNPDKKSVKGISFSKYSDDFYKVPADFRPDSAGQVTSDIPRKTFAWILIVTSLLGLLYLFFYPTISRYFSRAP